MSTDKPIRVVRVPWQNFWLDDFNQKFRVDKSSYDGRFKSILGPGYCTADNSMKTMTYNFTDLPADKQADLAEFENYVNRREGLNDNQA